MNMENERRRELVYQALVDFGSGHLTYHFSDGTQQGGWFERKYIDSDWSARERRIRERRIRERGIAPILTTGWIRECSVDDIVRIESDNHGEERRLLFRDEK